MLKNRFAAPRPKPFRRESLIVSCIDRSAEMVRLYGGMNSSMGEICAGYGETELELLADFLRRTANAGRTATDELASD